VSPAMLALVAAFQQAHDAALQEDHELNERYSH
jgi:hypothetical protein